LRVAVDFSLPDNGEVLFTITLSSPGRRFVAACSAPGQAPPFGVSVQALKKNHL